MSDPYKYWRNYPRAVPLQRNADSVVFNGGQLASEFAAHNPTMPVSAARAFDQLMHRITELDLELRDVYYERARHSMLYQKLIERGECP